MTARQIRSKGAVAISDKEAQVASAASIQTDKLSAITTSFPNSTYAASSHYSQAASPVKIRSPVRRFMHNARQSILPSYRSEVPPYPKSPPKVAGAFPKLPNLMEKNHTESSGATGSPGPSSAAPMEISAPLNINPQFAHLVKPRMSAHPSQRKSGAPF